MATINKEEYPIKDNVFEYSGGDTVTVKPMSCHGKVFKGEPFKIVDIIEDNYVSDDGKAYSISLQDDWELVQQNPAWSEEDEKLLKKIITDVRFEGYNNDLQADSYRKIRWLKSLKDRVQPKQDWSEEDESRMNNLCHFLEEYGNQYYGHLTLQGTISWLKSLRHQKQWKPSELQIEALESATANCAYSEYEDCLKELIKQLKQL